MWIDKQWPVTLPHSWPLPQLVEWLNTQSRNQETFIHSFLQHLQSMSQSEPGYHARLCGYRELKEQMLSSRNLVYEVR